MDLAERIRQLIARGLTEEEALDLAAASIKAQRSNSLAKRDGSGYGESLARKEPLYSIQQDQEHRRVDYGEETAAQAKARWIEQERQDPQGIYSLGGSSSSGIFGSGPIVADDYDPEAVNRTISGHAQLEQLRVQREMLQELAELRRARELQEAQARQLEARRQQLDEGRGMRRRLGRKKR